MSDCIWCWGCYQWSIFNWVKLGWWLALVGLRIGLDGVQQAIAQGFGYGFGVYSTNLIISRGVAHIRTQRKGISQPASRGLYKGGVKTI